MRNGSPWMASMPKNHRATTAAPSRPAITPSRRTPPQEPISERGSARWARKKNHSMAIDASRLPTSTAHHTSAACMAGPTMLSTPKKKTSKAANRMTKATNSDGSRSLIAIMVAATMPKATKARPCRTV